MAGTARAADGLTLVVQPSNALEWHGMANLDAVGLGTVGPLYVAPNLAVMMLEVAVHGGLVSGGKAAAKQRVQTEADRVLAPLRAVLDPLTPAVAEQAAAMASMDGKLLPADAPQADQRDRVTVAPVFFLSADLRAVAMEGAVSIDGNPMYTNLIRVVGAPVDANEPAAHWLDHEGAALRTEVGQLLAEAVRVAQRDAVARDHAEPAGKQASFRYPEGSQLHVERGTLVQADCQRLVLRTLRGALHSVPMPAASPHRPADCSTTAGN